MYQPLEQLRKLVFEGGFDEESRAAVINYERRLRECAETERAAEIPVVRDFLAYLEGEVSRAETLLKSDESLTDLQRNKLFAIIQVSGKYTHLLNGKARQGLEEAINRDLDAARNKGPL